MALGSLLSAGVLMLLKLEPDQPVVTSGVRGTAVLATRPA
jgi:hypothetical protein